MNYSASTESKNHGSFRLTDLHNAARKLDDGKLGKNFHLVVFFTSFKALTRCGRYLIFKYQYFH